MKMRRLIGYHAHFLNKASGSLKDFFISFTSHHVTPHLRQSPEVYPRTSVHMLAPVRAAENRAGSLILLGFFFFSRPTVLHCCGNTTSHMQRYSEVVMSQCFMTFPWGHLIPLRYNEHIPPQVDCQAHNNRIKRTVTLWVQITGAGWCRWVEFKDSEWRAEKLR